MTGVQTCALPIWDPRYLTDYIQEAQTKGFHRWFLYMGGSQRNTLTPCSFSMLWNEAKRGINWRTQSVDLDAVSDINELTSMFVGLKFFDKIKSWTEYVSGSNDDNYKISVFAVNMVYDKLNSQTKGKLMELMSALIGQTEKEFKNNDVGYYSMLDSLAFDSTEIIQQLTAYNAKYEEFKRKLWSIIEKNPVLQLCTNNAMITGNNINITQTMQCSQEIKEIAASDDDDDDDTPPTDDDNAPGNDTDTPSNDDDKNKKANPNGADDKPPTDDEPKNNISTGLIVAVIVVVGLIIAVIGIYLMTRSTEATETVENETDLTDNNTDKLIRGGLVIFV